jgi:hypothetical protein
VTVLRDGREPMTDIALLAEFKKNTTPWNSMPTRMLAKVAEANALRRQFPRQTTGLWIPEEMSDSVSELPGNRARPSPARVAPERSVAVSAEIIDAETIDPEPAHDDADSLANAEQLVAINQLVTQLGIDGQFGPHLENEYGVVETSDLTWAQANELIERLNARAARPKAKAAP